MLLSWHGDAAAQHFESRSEEAVSVAMVASSSIHPIKHQE
jgi:hypothetical protein